jgi:hypothetical protein
MFPEQLKKILNLVKQTGDRVILFDANQPDESYVVMNFDVYTKMSGAKEIVTKPAEQSTLKLAENNNIEAPDSQDSKNKTENLTEEDLTDKINREISMWKNRDDLSFSPEENKAKKGWSIPPQVKDKAQEVE